MTGGVLLTGGRSTRFGSDKAAAQLAGETLAERGARLLAVACAPVIEVGEGVSGLVHVREQPPFGGPVAAVLAAAAVIDPPFVVLACDHVTMTDDIVRRLADDHRDTVVPVVGGRPQYVAARYGPSGIAQLRTSFGAGDRSFRGLDLDALGAADVSFPAAAFVDVDEPDDLLAVERSRQSSDQRRTHGEPGAR